MFRRTALAIGSPGLLATSLTGTATAAPGPVTAPPATVPQVAVPQPTGNPLPKVISPADSDRIAGSADPAAAAAAATPVFVQNYNSAKCPVAQGHTNGTALIQYSCSYFADQYWYAVMDSSGHVWLENYNSGKCTVVQGAANGAQAFPYDCNSGYADQWWSLFAV
ncbi:RICIN domain-containing protein [Streptomyces sp. NPDC085639]|uniref:RICIN domain-containing protein n=1 Tax=Streptomyces sp. NPDC085639 TaxID=3365734 RepID=UPI0037CD03A6